MNKSQKLSVDEDEELIATANSGVHVIFVVQKWFYAPPPFLYGKMGVFGRESRCSADVGSGKER